jgi:hypothetical protein
MKRILLLAFIAIVSFGACKKKQEDVLASIKKKKEKIETKLKDYSFRKVDDLISDGNGVVSGYFKDAEAKKVSTQHFGKEKRSFTDFYFDDGMLIYAVSQDFVYNKPNYYTEELAKEAHDTEWYDDSKTKLEINKYYFSDNKLIKWTGPQATDVPVNIADFTKQEPVILAHALIALKQLKVD